MLLSRALCGVLGSLAVLPLELAQLALETGKRPHIQPLTELSLSCAGGAIAFATQATAKKELPPPWSTLVTVAALTPVAVTGQYLRLRARLGTRGLRPLFVAVVGLREAVLYSTLFAFSAEAYAPLIAHLISYPIKLLSIACYVTVAVRPIAVFSEILRASLALWCSTWLETNVMSS